MAPMEEHPNAQILRRGYDAFARFDLEAIQNLFADDVVFHVGGRNVLTGDYTGKDSVLGFLADLTTHTEGTYRLELHDVLGSDDHAVALVTEIGQRQGRQLDMNSVHVYHLSGGKVTEGWFHPSDAYADDEFWSQSGATTSAQGRA